MDWSAYIQTAIGIVVSVVLFLLGYRQTIGAYKERARAASEAVYRALLRRVALEEYQPHLNDITRLIQGKAQEFQVREKAIISPERLLARLYADVFDNDLIGADGRQNLLKRTETALEECATPEQESSFLQLTFAGSGLLALLAVGAAFAGTVAAITPDLVQSTMSKTELLPAFGAALGAVAVVFFLRTAPDLGGLFEGVVNTIMPWLGHSSLSSKVLRVLEDLSISYRIGGATRGDFTAEIGGRTIALVVREWKGSVELSEIMRALPWLERITRVGKAERIILVVSAPLRDFPTKAFEDAGVEVCPIRNLKELLQSHVQ